MELTLNKVSFAEEFKKVRNTAKITNTKNTKAKITISFLLVISLLLFYYCSTKIQILKEL